MEKSCHLLVLPGEEVVDAVDVVVGVDLVLLAQKLLLCRHAAGLGFGFHNNRRRWRTGLRFGKAGLEYD